MKPSRRLFLKNFGGAAIGLAAIPVTGSLLGEGLNVADVPEPSQQAHSAITKSPVLSHPSEPAPDYTAHKIARPMPFDWIGCYPRAGVQRNDGQSDVAWKGAFNHARLVSYLNRRQEILSSDSVILKTNSETEADWQKMLGAVDTMDNRLAQVNTIFRWIKSNIACDWDKDKQSGNGIHDPDWFRAPQDTLRLRKGVCIDQALLAMESLRLIGFPESDIVMESLVLYELNGRPRLHRDGSLDSHAVLGINIGGQKYVMDLTDRVGIWHEAEYYWPGGIAPGPIRKPFMATNFEGTIYYQKNYLHPRPLTAEETQAVVPQYSPSDKHRYESIPHLPPLQPYEIRFGRPNSFKIWPSLNQIIMKSPTSACVGTGCRF